MNWIKTLTIVGAAVLLSGCSTLTLVSFGISGLSYAISGKSVSDHVVSKLMAKDCALHRLLGGKAPCSEWPITEGMALAVNDGDESTNPGEEKSLGLEKPADAGQAVPLASEVSMITAHMASTPLPSTPLPSTKVTQESTVQSFAYQDNHAVQDHLAIQEKHVTAEDNNVLVAMAQRLLGGNELPGREVESISLDMDYVVPAQESVEQPLRFAVVGSFRELLYARERQSQYAASNARIISVADSDTVRYRVIIGPQFQGKQSAALSNRQEGPGNNSKASGDRPERAWILTLCPSTLLAPPCQPEAMVNEVTTTNKSLALIN